MRVVVVSLVLAGCGDSAAVLPDAPKPDAFSTMMFGGSMPQVVGNTSRVLAAPKVVAITYDNDTNRADTPCSL